MIDRPRLTFFCELDAAALTALFADRRLIAQLADLGARVSLGLRDLSAARAAVVRRLQVAEIPVIAWQLLPAEHGYWYNLANAAQAAEYYTAFQGWTRAHSLSWAGIGIDIEPDIRELARWFASPLRLAPAVARRALDAGRLRRAAAAYGALIERMRADSYAVESYIIPLIRDDRRAGATLLQRLAGLVDLAVDLEVPMLYSSFHRPYGPGVLWSYASEGCAAGLGSTGGGVDVGGIDTIPPLSWDEFSRDLRLAAHWCADLYIFSLEGCVRQGFMERLGTFDWAAPVELPARAARQTALARQALRAALVLSARPYLPLGLLGLGWLARRWCRLSWVEVVE